MLRMMTILMALVVSVTNAAADPEVELDPDQVRQALAQERKVHLQHFHEYRMKRVYPENTYMNGMTNIWRDWQEHLCAVATLVHRDGLDTVVDDIATNNNFVRTADLTEGPLVDWILTSGLTQEEIVMIQAPTEADIRAEEREQARQRAREVKRLAALYRSVEKTLTTTRVVDAGLDLATARLMQHPQLAQALLAKHPAVAAKD
jgi:hypothetical protein